MARVVIARASEGLLLDDAEAKLGGAVRCYSQQRVGCGRSSRIRALVLAVGLCVAVLSTSIACRSEAARDAGPPSILGASHRPGAPMGSARAVAPSTAADTAFAQYATRLRALERLRVQLATALRGAKRGPSAARILGRAREVLLRAFDETFFPAWRGTAWDYNGTTLRPRQGRIACGYYVTTLLHHAGFPIERARLAQQASERIIRTLVSAARVRRYRDRSASDVVRDVRSQGPGLYLVGLDNHVGFLRVRADSAGASVVRFCHASYLPPGAVTCEDPEVAAAFRSRYRVVGPLFEDTLLRGWLRARAVR